MRMVDLIEKKRDGFELSKEEIDFIISNYYLIIYIIFIIKMKRLI